ncbi:MAG: pilus assembly protein TadG-related protein [Pseudomonadota bacterium]
MFQRLAKNECANVAMITGLALIPMISVAGFAIDYRATTTSKVKVQAVVDSAVLIGARALQNNEDRAATKALIIETVDDQLENHNTYLSCQSPTITFADDDTEIFLDIQCRQDMSLLRVIGVSDMDFSVQSASIWGIGKLEVAFMFDVSGSMGNENRMVDLKVAAEEAVDILLPESGGSATDEVRLAMISYNTSVNAGDLFSDVTGLAPERTYTAEDTYIDSDGNVATQTVSYLVNSTCVFERPGDDAFTDVAPDFTVAGEAPVTEPLDIVPGATEPIYNAATSDENKQAFLAAGFAQYYDDTDSWSETGTACNPNTPLPLTSSRATLKQYITDLSTNGWTAGHQGVAWAWYMLAEPWGAVLPTAAAPYTYSENNSMKALILMTDGAFNRVRFNDQGNSDAQARALCDEIKDNGNVIIYTVAFKAGSDGEAVLAYCASEPELAFTPDDGEELKEVYREIASSLTNLRIKY